MQFPGRGRVAMLLLCAAAAVLASCTRDRGGPPRTAGTGGDLARPPEALWHLRAGLNVAALSCRGRGRKPVSGAYNRLLSHHRALLDRAYRDELTRHGKDGYDSHATRIYNRFANQRSPGKFCAAAAEAAREASSMRSLELAAAAPNLLSRLERQRR